MAKQVLRELPHNVEAEQALLGACLIDKEAINNAMEYVRSDDFYRVGHRSIFTCLQKLALAGEPCDLVTVAEELDKLGQLEQAGGLEYLVSLADTVPAVASAGYYAQIVAQKAVIRALIAAAAKIQEQGYTHGYEAQELLEMAEKSIMEIAENRNQGSFYHISDISGEVMEHIASIKQTDGVIGVPTFTDLDKILSGLQKSDLIILAARPGMGKTSMALNIAQQAAVTHGRRVAIFSLEMAREQLVQRMLCSLAGVDLGKVRAGAAAVDELNRLSESLGPLSQSELYIDDTAGITVTEMRSRCRKLKLEKKGLDLIVVDYLQLMQGSSRRAENRQQEIADISRSLKALAKELDVPILALSQLSRMAERGNEPPNLSHLRESGALEQDADIVIFIHRRVDDEAAEADGLVDIIVAKHRNGPVGTVKMVFVSKITAFKNYAKEWIGEPPPEISD
ncbi:MAG: replicative DNA helicase [Bacillota bacterium]|jgi:replicative DNA helicase